MRHTTRLSLLSLTIALAGGQAACMGNVGGGEATRGRGDNTDCSSTQKIETDVTISSQADFDELPACWDLWAKLTIEGPDITSLAPLGKLIGINELHLIDTGLVTLDADEPLKVYGPVAIVGNAKLTNLENLEVERADDLQVAVLVDDNAVLASLDGLAAGLTRVDGELTITNNPKLAAVSLTKLTAVGGETRISNNAALKTIELPKLATVHRIDVQHNVALTAIGGFHAAAILGDVVLRGNKALTTLGTMTSLDRIQGNLTIDDNDALGTVGMFSTAMQYLTGTLTISNNANLTDLGRLSHLRGIGGVNVSSNPKLSSCRPQEIQRCVPQLGSYSAVANLTQSNCMYWCEL